jgi:hypothetical protein
MHPAGVPNVALRLCLEVRPFDRERRMKDLTPIAEHANVPSPEGEQDSRPALKLPLA